MDKTQTIDSASSKDNGEYRIDPVAEKKLVRKLDLMVCPTLFFMYFLSHLDRSNVGNAAVLGMVHDMKLDVGNRYNIVLMVFSISYILFELPSNLILKHVRPSLYLCGLIFGWGIVTMCMGFVPNYRVMIGLRFLLGVLEAGLFPGIMYLTSMYYKRFEYQRRMNAIWSASLLSGGFGGLLAYGISHMGGKLGLSTWRWIFIVEGAFTALFGVIGMFVIPDWPGQHKYLSKAEKELLQQRLVADEMKEMNTLNRFTLRIILRDWKIWLGSIQAFGIITSAYSMLFFLPTILKQFGWEAVEAQVRSIPVYLVVFIAVFPLSYISDKLQHRAAFVFLPLIFPIIGYSILLQPMDTVSRDAKYAATFLVELAQLSMVPCIAWLMNNLGGNLKRACGAATFNMFGNVGGVVASLVFLEHEKPRYTTGFSVVLACICLSMLSVVATAVGIFLENKRRNRGSLDYRLGESEERLANMGDYHPDFRYTF